MYAGRWRRLSWCVKAIAATNAAPVVGRIELANGPSLEFSTGPSLETGGVFRADARVGNKDPRAGWIKLNPEISNGIAVDGDVRGAFIERGG